MELAILIALVVLIVIVIIVSLWIIWRGPSNNQQVIKDTVKSELQSITNSAYSQASEQLLTLANERLGRQTELGSLELDAKKQLIDQQLHEMTKQLEQVKTLVQNFERDRQEKFGTLTEQLKSVNEQTKDLTASTTTLREALSSGRVRGQWGERIADDILHLIGFVEGINYEKQKTIESTGQRPDFIFLLPGGLRLNMDVKFPFDNYMRFLEATTEAERRQHEADFVRDVRNHVKNVSTREYIDPEGGTVDYALLFIPNEGVYTFLHEADRALIDQALSSKVVCCSPFTLFAVLSVVRHAVDTFALQKASEEIIRLIGRFNSEWNKFVGSLEDLGKRLQSTQKAYDQVVGPRKRMLERPLRNIESLRKQKGLDVAPLNGDSMPILAEDYLIGSPLVAENSDYESS